MAMYLPWHLVGNRDSKRERQEQRSKDEWR
jgi:hypothetical protein